MSDPPLSRVTLIVPHIPIITAMMKTLYATSLYLLITCLRVTSGSVNGLDSPPLIKLQNEAFKTCITFHDTSSPSLLPSAAFLSVVYLDCKLILT